MEDLTFLTDARVFPDVWESLSRINPTEFVPAIAPGGFWVTRDLPPSANMAAVTLHENHNVLCLRDACESFAEIAPRGDSAELHWSKIAEQYDGLIILRESHVLLGTPGSIWAGFNGSGGYVWRRQAVKSVTHNGVDLTSAGVSQPVPVDVVVPHLPQYRRWRRENSLLQTRRFMQEARLSGDNEG